MPLRSARDAMGGTIRALREGGVPVAHRFVGVARQRGSSRGTLHSDHRNYMLSTLKPGLTRIPHLHRTLRTMPLQCSHGGPLVSGRTTNVWASGGGMPEAVTMAADSGALSLTLVYLAGFTVQQCPGATVLYARATRSSSLLRAARTGGAGQLAPGPPRTVRTRCTHQPRACRS